MPIYNNGTKIPTESKRFKYGLYSYLITASPSIRNADPYLITISREVPVRAEKNGKELVGRHEEVTDPKMIRELLAYVQKRK